MRYVSTRDNYISYDFSDILMRGLAPDGGLFMPLDWPALLPSEWRDLQGKPYHDVAFHIMRRFTQGTISDNDLYSILEKTYHSAVNADTTDSFRDSQIAPLHHLADQRYVMELFHGPTLAFKDVALQFLGQIFDHHLKRTDQNITIIGATSGDTGSAAIEGCKNCANARIIILHPHERTSNVQRRQMTTVQGDNIFNIALEGTFDDCQNIVKQLFANETLNAQHNFTAINSINWARIMAQIVYYATSALSLGAPDEDVQFIVPTGNFGNILAAYGAARLGVPIKKLIVATNENDILTRFTHTGVMERADVHHTISPSMDIQISSNFERYLFELFDRNENELNDFMDCFKTTGRAQIDKNRLAQMQQLFAAYRIDDAETTHTIKDIYQKFDYVLDPHSAVGVAAMNHALEDGVLDSGIPSIALACAHPAKFPDAVKAATSIKPDLPASFDDLFTREERYTVLPNDINAVIDFINRA